MDAGGEILFIRGAMATHRAPGDPTVHRADTAGRSELVFVCIQPVKSGQKKKEGWIFFFFFDGERERRFPLLDFPSRKECRNHTAAHLETVDAADPQLTLLCFFDHLAT